MKNKDDMRNDVRAVVQQCAIYDGARSLVDDEKPHVASMLFAACGLMMFDPTWDVRSFVNDVLRTYRAKNKRQGIESISNDILIRLWQLGDIYNMLAFFQRAFSKLQPRSFFDMATFDSIVDDEEFVAVVVDNATTTMSNGVVWLDEAFDALTRAMCGERYKKLQNDDDRAKALSDALIAAFPHCSRS